MVKGWTKSKNKLHPYTAQITINNVTHYLGQYKTAREAHRAYMEHLRKHEAKQNPALANHRKQWTPEEEKALVDFMLDAIRNNKPIPEALKEAAVKLKRKSCDARWRKYGLIDIYYEEYQQAKKEARLNK